MVHQTTLNSTALSLPKSKQDGAKLNASCYNRASWKLEFKDAFN